MLESPKHRIRIAVTSDKTSVSQDLKKEKNQDLDDDEFINCIEVAKNDVLELIGTMQFPHALMGTALASYIKFKGIKLV